MTSTVDDFSFWLIPQQLQNTSILKLHALGGKFCWPENRIQFEGISRCHRWQYCHPDLIHLMPLNLLLQRAWLHSILNTLTWAAPSITSMGHWLHHLLSGWRLCKLAAISVVLVGPGLGHGSRSLYKSCKLAFTMSLRLCLDHNFFCWSS